MENIGKEEDSSQVQGDRMVSLAENKKKWGRNSHHTTFLQNSFQENKERLKRRFIDEKCHREMVYKEYRTDERNKVKKNR